MVTMACVSPYILWCRIRCSPFVDHFLRLYCSMSSRTSQRHLGPLYTLISLSLFIVNKAACC